MLRPWLRAAYSGRCLSHLLYLLLGAPLGVVSFGYLYAMFSVSAVLLVTLMGLPLLAAGLRGARRLARAQARLVGLGLPAVTIPAAVPVPRRPGGVGWIRAGLADLDAWRAVLYLLLRLPVGLAGLAVVLVFWGYGLVFTTVPAWRSLAPEPASRPVVLMLVGTVLLVGAPVPTAAMVALDRWLLRVLLGPSRTSRLRHSRAAVLEDSAARLRRIERDLHDGAQAQLVALAMHLGMAKEELVDGDAPAALELLDTAHAGAKRAIAELRDLARGVYPPVLDSGIAPALESLAARSAIPVTVRMDLAERPSPAIESIVYFVTAELVANAAKHSRAARVTVSLTARRPGRLRLTVHDDGIGGAHPDSAEPGSAEPDSAKTDRAKPGTGLAGLVERIGAVDGALTVTSPVGGPTVVHVDLPVHA